ncbi:MAG TPA: FkbM family methyltransferase [Nitrososphaeraceae archaeon]|jgi:FkbM family methyltransferase|nr:FkbM family methyltransferase [Nitrososphaeraceae archaeon]
MKERTTLSNQDSIGSNSWWLRETKGATILDKFYLSFLKIIYRGIRFSFKIALGKKRTDMFYTKRGINFKDFLYRAIKFLKIGDPLMLEIYVPKHNYNIYCPLNKEDFIVMTRHEDDIIERFLPKQGDIVVDIGAHMGRYTIISSKRVGTNGKVVAIEAHPSNFEMLKSNIKLNQLTNVTPLNYAVYSKETKIKLYLPDEESGYTMHHSIMSNYVFTKYKDKTEDKFVEVNANTLDYLLQLNKITDVNWVKIDVEGAEFEVLKGAHNVLLNSKDISLLIEVHGKDTYEPIIESLRSYNFKIDFEKTYENGEKHIIALKDRSTFR